MKIPFRKALSRAASTLIESRGYQVVKTNRLYEWQRRPGVYFHTFRPGPLPAGADAELAVDNPRLLELRGRYDRFGQRVTIPLVWSEELVRPDDLKFFRGDNAYVWQLRGRDMNPLSYALTAYYLQSIDKLHLLGKLVEDQDFGIFTFNVADKVVSRDLLDSVNELNFLHRELSIGDWPRLNMLDIGAGYGRLAYRTIQGLDNVGTFLCTDAVATSTFLSEYYLRFRGVDQRARVVPLDEIDARLAVTPIDLAVNIHSFSECSASAIDWWLALLARHSVRYLFVVPNAVESVGRLVNHAGEDFGAIIEGHGYRPRPVSPKYADPTVQEYGVASTHYHLFERNLAMLMRYLARLPGVPEVLGPIARRLRQSKVLPESVRVAIGDACATNLALPAYVRSFSATVGGVEIELGARPKVSLVGLAYYRGLDGFEPSTIALFAALARQARAIIDIGANAGVFALLAARLRPEARILAFEPHPMVAMSLARSVRLSGARGVEVLPTALGATTGYTTLFTTISDVLTSLDGSRVPDAVEITVPVTTLDAVVMERQVLGIDLVKIDVEGWELPVFQGAAATFARDRPIAIFEALADAPAAAIDEFFAKLDYQIRIIAPGSLPRVTLASVAGTAPERNFVAVPSERLTSVLDAAGFARTDRI